MTPDAIVALAFGGLLVLVLLRVPIGIAMGVVGFVGVSLMTSTGTAMSMLALGPIRTATDYSLALIPLFILMGAVAGASGMNTELYRAANAWLGHRRGGLAMSTIAACGGFSAISGSSVATAATMAKVSLPEMKRYGYPDTIATGTVAAGGTLGILIPPSVILAVYGLLTEQDIGKLFVAGLLPGLLAIALYMVTIRIYFSVKGAQIPLQPRASWGERLRAMRGVWAIALLFAGVITGLYIGVFTPSEAAGMGAVGAVAIGVVRRKLGLRSFYFCVIDSIKTSAGIFLILIGATMFGMFLTLTRVPQKLAATLLEWNLGAYPTLFIILAFLILLGCVLDAMAMMILMVPILFPVILALGFDPIWFGIIMVLTVELALITPPVGLNIFVLLSLAPGVSIATIYRGVLPFVAADMVRLGILIAFPILVLFLPNTM